MELLIIFLLIFAYLWLGAIFTILYALYDKRYGPCKRQNYTPGIVSVMVIFWPAAILFFPFYFAQYFITNLLEGAEK